MKKDDYIKSLGLFFTRKEDTFELTGTISEFEITTQIPIKIEFAGVGKCFAGKTAKYLVKITNTELNKGFLFVKQGINTKYRTCNSIIEYSVPVLDLINAFRKQFYSEIKKTEYCVCERCGGTGTMPFSYANGICFRCEGSGIDPKMLKIC